MHTILSLMVTFQGNGTRGIAPVMHTLTTTLAYEHNLILPLIIMVVPGGKSQYNLHC